MDNRPIDQMSREEQLNHLRNAMMQKAFGQQTPIEETEEYKQAELAAQKQREGNQMAQYANILATMTENITGARKGHRLGMQEDAINKLKALQAQRGKSGQDSLAALRSLYNMENTREMAASKEEGKQERHGENFELRKNKFKWQQGEEDEKQLDAELNRFRKDDVVKIADQQINAGRVAIEMLSHPNPIMDEAVKTQLARAVGEKGALSESDIARFGSSRQIIEKIEQIWDTYIADGQLSDENRQYLQEIASVLQKTGQANKDARAVEFAKQRGFGKYDKQLLYDTYTGNAAPEWQPKRAEPTTPEAKPVQQTTSDLSDEEQKELEELERLEAEGKL